MENRASYKDPEKEYRKGYERGYLEAISYYAKNMANILAIAKNPPPIIIKDVKIIGKILVDKEDLEELFSDAECFLHDRSTDHKDYEELDAMYKKYFPKEEAK